MNLRKVEFENNSKIKMIEKDAFRDSSLECFSVPRHVTMIGNGAFSFCNSLKRIDFTSNSELNIIDHSAFYYSSVESFFIPSKVSKIGQYVFISGKN
ncbi:hypothetical protein M9Y10_037612 [Tritrichomonas musculus]|uniref:Uncharacterized protein n=1 Tax=Tritrichomonas musculus TaxID=1915356 RepID=A0ABR2GTZ3_9EUKA